MFPQGAYSVGDRWATTVNRVSSSNCFVDTGNCTTDLCCLGVCDPGCPPGWNCGNYDCSPFPIGICFPCTRNRCAIVCNTTWQSQLFIYEFRPLEWQLANGVQFNPGNPAHGWVYRYAEWRSGIW